MRKTLTTVFAMALLAGSSFGGIGTEKVVADFTTVAQASNGWSEVVSVKGFLEQIDIIPTGSFTSSVTITYTPETGSAVNIYTNTALTAQTILHPAVDKTDVTGAALTGDDPTRYIVDGGTLTVTVDNVHTTALTSAIIVIKTEK
jgi:hypothetical protein